MRCWASGSPMSKRSKHSTFTAEVHVRYLRELLADAPVRVTFQLLGFDAKRMHYFEELHHAEEGWLSATSENMALHVDMTAKKAAAFPDGVMARLAGMKAAHDRLPLPRGRRPADRHAASAVTEILFFVIPERREAPRPESITDKQRRAS